MGRTSDIMNTFKTHKALIETPSAWRVVLESFPKATCWYPAQISSQVREIDLLPNGMLEPSAEHIMPHDVCISAHFHKSSSIQPWVSAYSMCWLELA